MHPALSRRLGAVALLGGLCALGAPEARAHDIPARVTVQTFFKPDGSVLRVLVRVPLEAMRDIEFPLRWPGYLDLAQSGTKLLDAARLWVAGSMMVTENGAPLPEPRIAALQVSLPSDRSFDDWDNAIAHVRGPPLPPETELIWQQALLDVLLEYPITSATADFAIRSGFDRLGQQTRTVVRFLPPGRGERAFELSGDEQHELVRLDPHWYQAAGRFVRLGMEHILSGIDHLLFIFCLVIPFRRIRPLLLIVTAFTIAHSVTLIASTLGLAPNGLWFPPLIETLIAVSILYMAFENILGAKPGRRWMLAFGFGLVHGFGFSFFLRNSLQFAGAHLATALVSFNLGVELGQILVLTLTVPVLNWLFRRVPERAGTILLSALVAHTAWHWMLERLAILRQFRLTPPAFDPAFLGGALRVAVLGLVACGAGWLVLQLARRWGSASKAEVLESVQSRGGPCDIARDARRVHYRATGAGHRPEPAASRSHDSRRGVHGGPGDQGKRDLFDDLFQLPLGGDPCESGLRGKVVGASACGTVPVHEPGDAQGESRKSESKGVHAGAGVHAENERDAGRSDRAAQRSRRAGKNKD